MASDFSHIDIDKLPEYFDSIAYLHECHFVPCSSITNRGLDCQGFGWKWERSFNQLKEINARAQELVNSEYTDRRLLCAGEKTYIDPLYELHFFTVFDVVGGSAFLRLFDAFTHRMTDKKTDREARRQTMIEALRKAARQNEPFILFGRESAKNKLYPDAVLARCIFDIELLAKWIIDADKSGISEAWLPDALIERAYKTLPAPDNDIMPQIEPKITDKEPDVLDEVIKYMQIENLNKQNELIEKQLKEAESAQSDLNDDDFKPARFFADHYGLSIDAVNKKLERKRKTDGSGWVKEIADRSPREPKYLYNVGTCKRLFANYSRATP